LRLVSIALLNAEQIKQLKELYNKNSSTTTLWTEEHIKQFVIDEKIQIKSQIYSEHIMDFVYSIIIF
jgi:hypothetical protein